jgi:hypothetical protein
MRLPEPLLAAVKARAKAGGIPTSASSATLWSRPRRGSSAIKYRPP